MTVACSSKQSEKLRGPIRSPSALSSCIAAVLAAVPEPTPDQAILLAQLHELKGRLQQSRVQIAVLGQFKRGKSTLLNALLEARVLPTAVTPLTAIPTFIQSGTPALRLVRLSGEEEMVGVSSVDDISTELARYVTEEGNPKNIKGLARVDIFLESSVLSNNLCFIDTPGIGSTFIHNSETAEATLPHCDAALFVVSPDPPITAAELDYLHRVRSAVGRLFIVLNKIDIVDDADLDRAESFLRNVLTRQAGVSDKTPLFRVAARSELDGRNIPPRSQLGRLKQVLTELRPADAESILAAAAEIKIRSTLTQLLNGAEIQLRALRMPVTELERRVARFDAAADELREERRRAFDLLAGDRSRILARIETEAAAVRQRTLDELRNRMEQALASGIEPDDARREILDAVPDLFEREFQNVNAAFTKDVDNLFRSHADRIYALAAAITTAAAEAFDIELYQADRLEPLADLHAPYWVTSGLSESLIPSSKIIDHVLPKQIRITKTQKRLLSEIDTIVTRNVENLRWSMRLHLEKIFDQFSDDLRETLETEIAAATSLIKSTKENRSRESATTEKQSMALRSMQERLLHISRNEIFLYRNSTDASYHDWQSSD